jgi:protocatechuate 3,4-dioxygenase, beta subunit
MSQPNLILLLLLLSLPGCSQNGSKNKDRIVGGGCEGCEAIHEYGTKHITNTDTLPDYFNAGPKLEISGTIYHRDGKTPAKDVILYIYHTDQGGIYPTKGDEKGWARRHGYIRGWIKTNEDGKYKFYTLRPGAYPGRQNPEHIHPVIKEPGKSEYWIDEFLFDDDPILTKHERTSQQQRGGSGIIKTTKKDGIQIATRDITLGLNVPDYD